MANIKKGKRVVLLWREGKNLGPLSEIAN